MTKFIAITAAIALTQAAHAEDLLIKLASPISVEQAVKSMNANGLKASAVSDTWIEVKGNVQLSQFKGFLESGSVIHAQKNFKLNTFKNPSLEALRKNPAMLKKVLAKLASSGVNTMAVAADNPAIPNAPARTTGADPLFSKQWGMNDINVTNAWKFNPSGSEVVVAVIDTGVDYTHEDLAGNLWRNPSEIPNNGIDDDRNGYIDDVIGWDMIDNDNKPYDLAGSTLDIVLKGANPGHGTHCAGNVAAVGNNGKGIAGVAPEAKIMALRFIGNEGGTTADAIKAIRYAVDNGAKVLSNSWGSSGEDPKEATENQALRDAVQYAQDKGVLFIAAAGNGDQMGKGYDNDSSKVPAYPASYPHDNIISVAAIDSSDNLGTFSNFGFTSVDIGAPGVKVFSTIVGSKYSDSIGFSLPGIFEMPLASWDGTSMATPHVAGAAALYWSAYPAKTWQEVKMAILSSAKKTSTLNGKVSSGGKLNVEALMKY